MGSILNDVVPVAATEKKDEAEKPFHSKVVAQALEQHTSMLEKVLNLQIE